MTRYLQFDTTWQNRNTKHVYHIADAHDRPLCKLTGHRHSGESTKTVVARPVNRDEVCGRCINVERRLERVRTEGPRHRHKWVPFQGLKLCENGACGGVLYPSGHIVYVKERRA